MKTNMRRRDRHRVHSHLWKSTIINKFETALWVFNGYFVFNSNWLLLQIRLKRLQGETSHDIPLCACARLDSKKTLPCIEWVVFILNLRENPLISMASVVTCFRKLAIVSKFMLYQSHFLYSLRVLLRLLFTRNFIKITIFLLIYVALCCCILEQIYANHIAQCHF